MFSSISKSNPPIFNSFKFLFKIILSFVKLFFLNTSLKLLNSNSLHIFINSSSLKLSNHSFFGIEKLIDASFLIVANVLEKIASSSPSIIKLIILSVILFSFFSLQISLNFSILVWINLYIFSILWKRLSKVVAVFSPIPFIPIILSDVSPLNPL